MNAREIVAALKGSWHGSYGTVRCVAHDDTKPSLQLRDGNRRLLVKCYAGCSHTDILGELRRQGFLCDGGEARGVDVADAIRREQEKASAKAAKDATSNAKIRSGCTSAHNTLVERYLRGRGIALPIPGCLLFHPRLFHTDTAQFFPGMVALVEKAAGIITHRTFLSPHGGKANVNPDKKLLGDLNGGAIRLAPVAEEMAFAEGIETAMSFQQIYGIPTWSAVNTSGLKGITLPALPAARTIHIAMDIDPKRGGEKAAHAAAERFEKQGREVRIHRPSIGCKDFNDMVKHDAAA